MKRQPSGRLAGTQVSSWTIGASQDAELRRGRDWRRTSESERWRMVIGGSERSRVWARAEGSGVGPLPESQPPSGHVPGNGFEGRVPRNPSRWVAPPGHEALSQVIGWDVHQRQ